jgi:hypothetical protein
MFAASQIFGIFHFPLFLSTVLLSAIILYFMGTAKSGKLHYIRSISGLKAIDEAVGRATELGKPVLFISGLADVDNVQTLAALSILSHVARKTAEYDTSLVMPNNYSVTMVMAQEVVREAHLKVGRPDTFQPENIYYVSDAQFAFVGHVLGVIERSKPAANIYMGRYFAESLILAEAGFATKAIQIAGTAETPQLPFFFTACDYCLIGEELFAASAYLSKNPKQTGSIKAQDVIKVLILAGIAVGAILATLH